MFFFPVFGNLLLRLFDVPLSMVQVVGGVILMRIGLDLFAVSQQQHDSGKRRCRSGCFLHSDGHADHGRSRRDCHCDRPDLNNQEFRA
jgi:hypothetical protein